MNKKIILIISFLLLGLISLGAVSAADIDVQDQAVDDMAVTEIQEDTTIGDVSSISVDDGVSDISTLSEDGDNYDKGDVSSLQKMINEAEDRSTINLSECYVINYYIEVNKNITIEGNGNTIEGNESALFYIEGDDVTVIFKDVKFINGYCNPFNGLKAPIHATCKNLIFENCSFENNCINVSGQLLEPEFDPDDPDYEPEPIVMEFDGCVASVIYSACSNSTIINNCSFIDNSGTFLFDPTVENHISIGQPAEINYVSSIHVDTNIFSYFLLNNTKFENTESIMFLHYTLPEENDSVNTEPLNIRLLNEGRVVINNCSFDNAKQVINTPLWCESYALISNCNFVGDNSEIYNNLVYIPSLKLENCSFSNYHIVSSIADAYNWLGGVVCAIWYFNASDCQFINNTVEKGSGIVRCGDGDGYINNCSFINNSAMIAGALMCADTYINNSIFINNKALGYEGPVEYEGEIINYNVSAMGGAIYTQGDIQLSNSIFINNSAYDGGTIYVECINKLNVDAVSSQKMEFLVGSNISNCIFDNNFALNNGNFIFIAPSYLYLYYEEGWFIDENQWEREPGWYYNGDTAHTGHDMKLDMAGDEHFIASLNTNNLIFENNFWSNNSQFDIHVHELHNVPSGPYGELNCSEIKDSTFYPTSWVVMNINGPNVVSGPANYNVTLNTLNNGSEIEGSLPDYGFGIRCNNGELNISEITISNGIAYFTYTPQSSTSDVITVYSGEQNIATKDISITKIDPTVVISDSNVVYAEDVVINVTLPSNATGNVTLTIDGKTYIIMIVDGVAIFNIKNLNVGTYNITVSYKGDNNYNNASASANLTVNKVIPIIVVDVSDISYGEVPGFSAVVTGLNGAVLDNSSVTFAVYDKEGKDVTNELSRLSVGEYTVVASYPGNENYYAVCNVSNVFVVSKVAPVVNVVVDDVSYGTVPVIVANVTGVDGSVIGYVDVKVYDVNNVEVDINNRLAVGTYTVVANFAGNENYINASASANLTVNKVIPIIVVDVSDISYGEVPGFSAVVTGLNGAVLDNSSVTFAVYDKEGKDVTNELSKLSVGEYTVVASYPGNENYTVCNVSNVFVVSKVAPVVNVVVYDVSYGTVPVIVANVTGVDGSVIGYVDVKVYDVNNVEVDINNRLAVGTYTVVANFAGNENYINASASGSFVVNKIKPVLNVNVLESVDYGQVVVITVDVPVDAAGNVTLTIGGKNYTGSVEGGSVIFNISDLIAKSYDIIVVYGGDNNYTNLSASASFIVNKVDPSISVNVSDISYGEVPGFSSVVTGLNGVILDNSSVTFAVFDEDGNDVTGLNILAAGEYTVVASYPGNENNTSSKGFIVNKIGPSVSVDVSDISYGMVPSFSSVVTGLNGAVLDNSSVTFAVFDEDGNDVTGLNILAAGEYTVVASYSGNENYTNNTSSKEFTVNKKSVTLTPSALSTTYNSGNVFQVKVVDNNQNPVSGLKLTLNVYTGSSYQTVYVTTDASGIAKYSASKLSIGTHNVIVSLSDNNYVADNKTSSIKVSKATVTITPTALSTTYDSGKYFQVKVLDANKKAVSGLKLTLKIYTGSKVTSTVTVTTDASGIAKYSASKLSIGTHNIIVSLSDNNYVADNKTSSIKVSKATTTVTAPVVKFKKGAKKYFKVTVKNKATGKVVKSLAIKIKVYTGKKYKTYTVKTNSKGIAQLNTKALAKGTHKVVISSSNSKYTVSKSGKLIVIK